MADDDLHVVILPWSAFGHLFPLCQLGTLLAKKGVRVSYVATSGNVERLPKVPPELARLMQYVSVPRPDVPGGQLAEGKEATADVEYEEVQYLKVAYDLLREPVRRLVARESPDWVITDFSAHWMPEIAKECRAKLMFFSIFMPGFLAFMGPAEYLAGEGQKRMRGAPERMTVPSEWGAGVVPESLALRLHEAVVLQGAYEKNASGWSDGERLAEVLKGCDAIGVRGCREFDAKYIDLYEKITGLPVVPAGVLPPARPDERDGSGGRFDEAFEWLDRQGPGSVVYVAFGSEYKLTKEEAYEIAHGLELSQVPFVWALRRPTWAADDSEALPPGFSARTSGKGIVCLGWAPQLKILAHPSVGGTLYHCGYATTVETLQHGHKLILLPCYIDQGINSRVLAEAGLGIEVEKREDGSFTRDDVAHSLRRVMLGDDAERIGARTRQAATVFGDRELQEESYIGTFVEFLKNGAKNQ